MKRALPVLLTALLAGCVTSSKYKTEQARAATAEERLAETSQKLTLTEAAASKKQGELQAQIDTGVQQLASLQKSNSDLQDSLKANKDELTQKVSTLIKDKDALAQQLSDAQVQAAAKLKAATDALTASQARVKELDALVQGRDKELSARLADLSKAEQEKKALEAAKEAEVAKVKKSYEDLTANLKSEISAGEVTITQLKGKLTVNMVDRILFDSGKAEVRAEGKKVLDRVGTVLAGIKDKDIRIEGHTDNKPISGDLKSKFPSNWELSTARATAVARYLQDLSKIPGDKLVATGYGEFRPVAANDTPENRALNRRIEIVLVPKD